MNISPAKLADGFFRIQERGSTVKTELLAGLTTFASICYIIFVNSGILAEAGIPREAAVAATIWSTVFSSALTGLWANLPIAVAPAMGLNAFFTYTVVQGMGLPWQTALGAIFISGIVFVFLTLGGIRQAIVHAVPGNLRKAICVGVGAFIFFVGLHDAGIVVSDPSTLLTTGHIASIRFEMGKPAPLLALIGLFFTGALLARRVRCALLLGMLATAALGMIFGAAPYPVKLSQVVSTDIPSLEGSFLAMDLMGAVQFGIMHIVFTFTVIELFDNMGTLIGLLHKRELRGDKGGEKALSRALAADAVGTMVSAVVGTSTVTSYVESTAGIAAGGRTGLTALTVAALFALALFFAPLAEFVPGFATAPVLIIVGVLMMAEVTRIRFDDITDALPAFLTILMMPFTYNVTNGLAFGFISHVLLKLCAGKWEEINRVTAIIGLVFMINFALRLG